MARLVDLATLVFIVLFASVMVGQDAASAEQELFRAANEARKQVGAPPLEWNEWLAQAAREHAQLMASHNQLSHQLPGEPAVRDRLAARGLRFDASAENVAFGENSQEIQEGWMHSPPHRANMLNPKYTAVGIAVVRHGDSLFAVEDFAHVVPMLSSTDLENTVAEALQQIRREQHLPPMKRVAIPPLRQAACDMAKDNRVEGARVFGVAPQMRSAVAFADADPGKFASHMKRKNVADFTSFAVGACFARSPAYAEGTNWVLVGFM